MTVSELAQECGFDVLAMPEPDRVVKGAYIGDLLSWVMGRASEGNAWITIMTNVNTLAVASLSDCSCVILSEGVGLSEDLVETAMAKMVNVLSTKLPSYETALAISGKIDE